MPKITLELYNPVSVIQLAQKISNVSKCRVEAFRYITANSGQKYLLIQVGEFLENVFLSNISGTYHNKNCTKIFMLDSGTNQLIRYSNMDSNSFDTIGDTKRDLYNFQVQIYIDGVLSNDISASNPVLISLHFE